MNKKQTYGLALLSAFIMWLAWPPHTWLAPLLLIGLVPLFIALANIDSKATKKRGKKIFLTAGFTFLVWNTASIYWVFNAINSASTNVVETIISLFVSLIPFGLGALLMTFAFWLYYRLKNYVGVKIAYLGLISFYISMEYLHQSWQLNFPWMNLGNGFAGLHQFIQWYEYTGVYGGSVWILLSNILAFEGYKALVQKNTKAYQPILSWILVLVIPIGFSLYTYFTYEEKTSPVNVVVVQPNIDPYEKLGGISPEAQLAVLTHLSDSAGQVNTEYFFWPETALPIYADEDQIRSNPTIISAQQFISKYKNGTLITGMEGVKWYNTKETESAQEWKQKGIFVDHFNSAIQLENSAQVNIYHKSKLVPGVERMPFPQVLSFLAPVFRELGGSISGWGTQDAPEVFYAHSGVGVTPVICYESIFGSWVAQSVKDGAQFIAIITNDGWWGNTSGKDQHFMYAKLRAIETRRWVARSANTGISGFINQRGDVVKRSKWWTSTALKEDINLNDTLTFYVHNGDVLAKLFSVLALLLALIIPYIKWMKKN
ncbi:apolipoprotein N-acyltransferase [Pedobacter sp. Du54]|uniref:apolipoprotein N-acyltransferase n=1 Tax=Pedobacter anseongensis TaxID=3133439 RepID=UPI0030B61008